MQADTEIIDSRKPLILIVDDIPANLQVLGNILSQESYEIALAVNGRQALTLVENTHPDLILLDVVMPELDGFQVCRSLKSNDETKDIPVIFLTAKNEAENVVRGFELGAVDYLTKPFNASELLARVRTHINLKLAKDHQSKLLFQLRHTIEQAKVLSGLIPICAHCKSIRDDKGYWNRVESFIEMNSDVQFSHGICTDCVKELYPDYFDEESFK